MINWIKYDPQNPPSDGVEYFISDGIQVDVAYFYNFGELEWYLPDCSCICGSGSVTHYAPINLPGEGTE
ncbi:MAG: hypothetical protein ACQEXX_19900 [Bacillota bacterium]